MMLARTALRPALVAQPIITATQARNMATLREIELRLKSVQNIEKITKVRCTASKSFGRNGQ
jgi:F-type H+-transporting ATPase subunit gamma